MVPHDGMRTINTGSVAVGRYLNLDPVQGRAANLVQLSFDPFKHVSPDPRPYRLDIFSVPVIVSGP